MARNKKQVVYNEQSDQESPRSRNRSRDRSRDREGSAEGEESGSQQSQREESEQQEEVDYNRTSQKNQQITPENVATQIRQYFLDLFGKIKQEKGFVFTPQDRTKMINQQKKSRNQRKIHWNPECLWERQQEVEKIDKLFGEDYRGLDKLTLDLIKGIFLNVSYLFANEITDELYQILLNILNIVLDNGQNSQERIKEFMSFMLRDQSQYIFFSLKFSKHIKVKVDARTTEEAYHQFGIKVYEELKRALITI